MKKLKSEELILLIGNDNISKENFIEQWIKKKVPQETKDFNLDIFYPSETSGNDIVNMAMSLPMMAEHRTIIVRHANKLSSDDVTSISEYAKNPSLSTTLILEAEKIDGRKEAWKKISKLFEKFEYKIPYQNKVPAWIVKRCRDKYGRHISVRDSEMLCAYVGFDITELDSELKKLDVFIDSGKSITEKDIKEVVGQRAENIFSWISDLGYRKTADALAKVDGVLETDSKGILAINSVARHFYSLLKIKIYQDKKYSDKEIAEKTGLNYWWIFQTLGMGKQATLFSLNEIEKILEKISSIDRLLKSSTVQIQLVLSSLTFEICRIKD